MSERQSEKLSAAGEVRREAMLDELVQYGRRGHRLRRLRRRVLAMSAFPRSRPTFCCVSPRISRFSSDTVPFRNNTSFVSMTIPCSRHLPPSIDLQSSSPQMAGRG